MIDINELNFPELHNVPEPYTIQATLDSQHLHLEDGARKDIQSVLDSYADEFQLLAALVADHRKALAEYERQPADEGVLTELHNHRSDVADQVTDLVSAFNDLRNAVNGAVANDTGHSSQAELRNVIQRADARIRQIEDHYRCGLHDAVDLDDFHTKYITSEPEDRVALDTPRGSGAHRRSWNDDNAERIARDPNRTPTHSMTPQPSPPPSPDIPAAIRLPPIPEPPPRRDPPSHTESSPQLPQKRSTHPLPQVDAPLGSREHSRPRSSGSDSQPKALTRRPRSHS
jgi:hypothetical protein